MEKNIDYIKGSVYYGHMIAWGRDDWEVMVKTCQTVEGKMVNRSPHREKRRVWSLLKGLFVSIMAGMLSACHPFPDSKLNIINPDTFAGIYTANNDGEPYHLVINTISPDSNRQGFLIFGFSEDRKAQFMQEFTKISTADIPTTKAAVCMIMQTKFCAKEKATKGVCSRKAMRHPSDQYLESPGQYGLLMVSQLPYGYLYGDTYDVIKGHSLLPKKEYVAFRLNINRNGELGSVTFRETGFIQAFTSETLTFQKTGQPDEQLTNHVYAYANIRNTLYDLANVHDVPNHDSTRFFDSCRF